MFGGVGKVGGLHYLREELLESYTKIVLESVSCEFLEESKQSSFDLLC